MRLTRLTFFIKAAELTQRAITTELLQDHGLTYAQLALLITILQAPGRSSAALARVQGMTAQSAGETIAALIGRGWVERVRDMRHAKAFRIYLTPSGTSVIEEVERVLQAIEDRLVAGIPASDLEATRRTLRQIVINGDVVADPFLLSSPND